MTWDNVPWFVDKANHSAESARTLAYLATGMREGVLGSNDCKVIATSTPSLTVRVMAGGVAMRNRFAGGGSQSYVGRNNGEATINLAAQGSSGVRYDLVAVIVEDPQYAGQPAPASVVNGPYIRTVVYQNVASTTRFLSDVAPNQTGYALALVKFAASDSSVTNAEITDLRDLLMSNSKQEVRVVNPTAVENVSSTNYTNLPSAANWAVDIPPWAVRVVLEADWASIKWTDTSNAAGYGTLFCRAALGSLVTEGVALRADATGANKPITTNAFAAQNIPIPASMRGTTQNGL